MASFFNQRWQNRNDSTEPMFGLQQSNSQRRGKNGSLGFAAEQTHYSNSTFQDPYAQNAAPQRRNTEEEKEAKEAVDKLRKRRTRKIWFLLISTLVFAATFAALLGCLSGPTKPLFVYAVSPRSLASRLAAASNGTLRYTDFTSPDLPRKWYIGLSGICTDGLNTTTPYLTCARSFPAIPNFSQLAVISLKNTANTTTVDIWKSALADFRVPHKTVQLTQLSAAFLVISMLIYPINILLVTTTPSTAPHWRRSLPAHLAVVNIALLAGTLAAYHTAVLTHLNSLPAKSGAAGMGWPGTGRSLTKLISVGTALIFFSAVGTLISLPLGALWLLGLIPFVGLCLGGLFYQGGTAPGGGDSGDGGGDGGGGCGGCGGCGG